VSRTLGLDLADSRQLHDAQRTAYVTEPEIVAQPLVREPAAILVSSLVSQRYARVRQGVVIRQDHAAFTRGDLLVRVEAEDTHRAERAGFLPIQRRAESFTTIFDDRQIVLGGDLANLVEAGRIAEDLDRQNSF